MLDDLDKNKSWCPIPWVTYSINSLGQYRLCVQANSYKPRLTKWERDIDMGMFTRGTLWESNDPNAESNKPLHCETTDLNDMRNNDFLKDVRAHMLRGERHPVCKRCNQEDDNDVKSRRMAHRVLHAEDGFTITDAFKTTTEDGTITDINEVPLLAADIRLSNLCNQKCRMCYPGESSSWYQEWHDTFQIRHVIYYGIQSKKKPKFTGPGNTKMTLSENAKGKVEISNYQILENEDADYEPDVLLNKNIDPYQWTSSVKLFERLSSQSPNINHIHMSGGEPLMITEHYEFLKGYVANGQAKDITLNYNTNLSNIPERALDLWQHFKLVELRGSVDAPGKMNEYIRHPSNWEIVLRNLRLLTDVKKSGKINLSLVLITTVQLYNVFYLRELLDEIRSHKDIEIDDMILHLLHEPEHFNITTLPLNVKDIVADKIHLLQEETPYWKKQGEGVIKHMYGNDTVESMEQFFIETRAMDIYRKEKFGDTFPELYELLRTYDKSVMMPFEEIAEHLDNAYMVNMTEKDIEGMDLKYTHLQIIRKKDES